MGKITSVPLSPLVPWWAPVYLVTRCHRVLNSCGWLHGLRHRFIHRRGRGKHPVLVRKSLCATRDPTLLGRIHRWLLVIQTSLHSALMLRDALQNLQKWKAMTCKPIRTPIQCVQPVTQTGISSTPRINDYLLHPRDNHWAVLCTLVHTLPTVDRLLWLKDKI